ncbi:alpha/beta hydrolase [Aeromicrobium sp.]|uniref:alpha/beta hydrolase n=1 Tax=Aeromicrobium sp. TaxID=1871063 RepID=UPI003D6A056B
METVEYEPGRAADVHPGTGGGGHVLLWHGRGPNERGALATLAGLVAERGPTVIVPDWSSESDDGGRADLLQSLRFTRGAVGDHGGDPDSLVLVGWSLGGTAAAGVTINARRLGVGFAHTVCLAGGFTAPDPISGVLLTGQLPSGGPAESRSPFTLFHGIADDIAPVTASRAFAQALELAAWPVEVIELPTDHAGIVGTVLSEDRESWNPATDEATLTVAVDVADRIAALT